MRRGGEDVHHGRKAAASQGTGLPQCRNKAEPQGQGSAVPVDGSLPVLSAEVGAEEAGVEQLAENTRKLL